MIHSGLEGFIPDRNGVVPEWNESFRSGKTYTVYRKRLFPPPEEPKKVEEKKIAIVSSFLSNNQKNSCSTQPYKGTHEVNNQAETTISTEEQQLNLILQHNTRENNNTNIDFEKEITFENINPIKVFRSLEIKESDNIRNVNRSLQKQKLSDENKVFR